MRPSLLSVAAAGFDVGIAQLGQPFFRSLGQRIYLVVEKLSELDEILRQSQALGVAPLLGVRVRLASIGAGNWQNTGGDKSKFGLHSAQVLDLIERLREHDLLDCLQLLHFHLGSQLANLGDITKGVGEAARFYAELHALGVPLQLMDVGGGLGVDYEGTASRNFCASRPLDPAPTGTPVAASTPNRSICIYVRPASRTRCRPAADPVRSRMQSSISSSCSRPAVSPQQ